MEYVEGNTVTYWLQVQQRSWKEILQVFRDAGHGLAAAHDKGLIHRDFKTDNVMVSRDRHVRVMDFGLARQVQEKQPPAPLATVSGNANAAGAAAEPAVVAPIPIRILTSNPAASNDGPSTMLLPTDPSVPPPPIPIEGRSSSGTFDARLTRTGAMMGTPAYMAPEQFLGTPTDARSDQFSFCIALYEALYGERPFEGSTMSTLTQNVVQGNVREAPAGSKVPLWVRKVLLRGLMPRAKDRWPSMEALIEALGKDPSVQRRKWIAAAAGICFIGGVFLGGRALIADQNQVCSGGPAKLAGIWDLQKPGEGEPARHAQLKKAFMATGKSYAPDVFATVSRALTTYAESWANMYRENCEATDLRHEQSSEVMDLRMECLQQRLGGFRALTDVFHDATGEVVENAVSAANALESLDRCTNVSLLRAVVPPPEDPSTLSRVSDLRGRLADIKARFDSGRWSDALKTTPGLVEDTKALGYQPLVAEVLSLTGTVNQRANHIEAAEKAMVEAYWVADAARHDEIRAEAATNLVFVVGYQEGHFADAQRWATAADAVLRRLGGHDLLRAWLANDIGCVYDLQGDKESALRYMNDGLALKKKALGNNHPDIGLSEGNLGLSLHTVGRDQEALTHLDRAIRLLEEGLGAGHPDLASNLSNRGEVLIALGRNREARQSFDRARAIWEREVGLDNLNLGFVFTGIGNSHLAEGNASMALSPLEEAYRIRMKYETEPSRRAETTFALARALWESNRDRVRARSLAERAKVDFEIAAAKTKLSEVDSWLRARTAIVGAAAGRSPQAL
jgi:tetratricopeptide (TPR) repeat protein